MNPAARPHRIDRLQRAWDLLTSGGVTPIGPDQFQVRGTCEPFYYVDLNVQPACYCGDMEHRERLIKGQCKHVIACKLTQLDALLLDSLAGMIAAHERALATYRAEHVPVRKPRASRRTTSA